MKSCHPLALLFAVAPFQSIEGFAFGRTAVPFSTRQRALEAKPTDDDDDSLQAELLDLGGDPFFLQHDKPTRESLDDDRISEIEELGGDPFFPFDDVVDIELREDEIVDDRRNEIEEIGVDPFFMTDKDNAVVGDLDGEEKESFPSESIMKLMAMSAQSGGGVMDLISKNNKESVDEANEESPQEPQSMSMEERISELEEIGGDPFFLSDEDTYDTTFEVEDDEDDAPSEAIMAMAASREGSVVLDLIGKAAQDTVAPEGRDSAPHEEDGEDWEWDGFVDEEAHLGFL